MHFTKQDLETIRRSVLGPNPYGVRDTQLDEADPINGSELVAIIQDGRNRICRTKDIAFPMPFALIDQIIDGTPLPVGNGDDFDIDPYHEPLPPQPPIPPHPHVPPHIPPHIPHHHHKPCNSCLDVTSGYIEGIY